MRYKSDNIWEIARELFPDVSDFTIEFLVWEKTCFPFDNREAVRQLERLAVEWYSG
ncbi:hypothetical protein E308F_17790 [Moorella sp. E308F]|uniref:hypothetical protein n=1 Tax=unclassified Neomoorella TaxID=2676739 RepID=UPI0010FFC732|nr:MULTISPECIES: hypothetical protein [unclassified Moorella (in: firmicutes)]GEA15535.1 hypothetical protein E308F_17790 [Moorella sp. E308F]GEA19607.1 hypothetical protein E306M_27450 [Moorella sp. E306M]